MTVSLRPLNLYKFGYNEDMIGQSATHSESSMDTKRHLVSVLLERMDTCWTPSEWIPSGKPADELVATILSQNTSDTNTERAFASLRKSFPRWLDVIEAPVEEVIDSIRAGGLAQQKAPRIQQALRQLVKLEDDDLNQSLLRQLEHMSSGEAMKWLTGMPGVGPKTAACVLLFAAGKPVIPVDTHVFRVSKRTGLIDSSVDANRAHNDLLSVVPPEESYRFHMHLIHHGRTVCKARNPRCDECIIRNLCDYGMRSMPSNT